MTDAVLYAIAVCSCFASAGLMYNLSQKSSDKLPCRQLMSGICYIMAVMQVCVRDVANNVKQRLSYGVDDDDDDEFCDEFTDTDTDTDEDDATNDKKSDSDSDDNNDNKQPIEGFTKPTVNINEANEPDINEIVDVNLMQKYQIAKQMKCNQKPTMMTKRYKYTTYSVIK